MSYNGYIERVSDIRNVLNGKCYAAAFWYEIVNN